MCRAARGRQRAQATMQEPQTSTENKQPHRSSGGGDEVAACAGCSSLHQQVVRLLALRHVGPSARPGTRLSPACIHAAPAHDERSASGKRVEGGWSESWQVVSSSQARRGGRTFTSLQASAGKGRRRGLGSHQTAVPRGYPPA